MLSKTFYRNSPTSKAIQPSHAAAADLNNAIEHLQRILKLDTPPRDPLTNATAAPPSDTTNHINACVTALQNLKLRLERHALLLTRIAQARTQIAQTSRDTSSRTIDMEQNTIAVQSQLTGILEEKESLMRELLVVRHDLEVRFLLPSPSYILCPPSSVTLAHHLSTLLDTSIALGN